MTQSPIPHPLADAIAKVKGALAAAENLIYPEYGKTVPQWYAQKEEAITSLNSIEAALEAFAGKEDGVTLPDDCDGKEQGAFEDFLRENRYDMTRHPLHWLFLNPKTFAARQGWKAAIQYCIKVSQITKQDGE